MTALPSLAAGLPQWKSRRNAALTLLRVHRAALVRCLQRTYLALLLDCGPSTTDPLRAAVPTPEGTDPRLVGAAVQALAKLDLIHRARQSRSVRPEAHGRDLPLWAVSDRAAALAWLTTHPELPDAAPEQHDLWP